MHGKDRWEPRNCEQLSKQLRSELGLPVDLSSKMGGLKAVCNALNEGDVARAQVAAVLLGIPEPPALSKSTRSRDEIIKFIRDLDWSGLIKWDVSFGSSSCIAVMSSNSTLPEIEDALIKAGYNPDEPRDERGRWTNGGSVSGEPDPADHSARIQLADAGMSDASDDPVVEAAARAGAAERRNADAKPVDSEHENFWQTIGSRLSDEAQSVLSAIGRAQINESNANVATATAEANAIADGLRAYANYRAQPWIGSDGRPVQVSVINTGDPLSDQAALMGHELSEPTAPLTRPATNADWIDPLVDVVSVGATGAGQAFRLIGAGVTAAADSSVAAADTEFVIPLSELPKKFDLTSPVGKVEIPENLVPGTDLGNYMHDRIGKLFQRAVPNVKFTLNTAPSINGPDIEVPEDAVFQVGFRYAEIKPLSSSGLSRFKNQVLNVWDLEGQVQPITYDYNGNIYYGFPGLWQ